MLLELPPKAFLCHHLLQEKPQHNLDVPLQRNDLLHMKLVLLFPQF